jgi:hypothetical protein
MALSFSATTLQRYWYHIRGNLMPMLCGFPSPWHGVSSGCGWGRQPSSMESSCEYIDYEVVESLQGVVHQLQGWSKGRQLLTAKKKKPIFMKCYKRPRAQGREQWRALVNMVMNFLTYILTYSMMQDIIWKADCHSASQKISCFLMEAEGLLPCSQKPATGTYPEPAESSSPHRSLSP